MLGNRKTAILFGAAIAVRLLFTLVARIDSDEPQHLHVAWGWSRGFVQYRDVFDNHFPLLHLLFAPLMAVMPESSATFLWMRLAILPLAVACAWLLYRIGKPLIGSHAAASAACIFGVLPPWMPKSVEFRNDTLWIFFWLAALALLMGRRTPAYALAGAAAALCLLASAKALPLVLAHALALASQRERVPAKALVRFACGAAIPLVAVGVFLYARGALGAMFYAALLFNASLPIPAARRVAGALAFIVIAPALLLRPPARVHLALVAIWYPVILLSFWPLLTPRDFLPLVPLAALALSATRPARALPATLFLLATSAAVLYARLWQPPDPSRAQFVDAAVSMTGDDDYVFDLKGEAVFRRRPVKTVYESVSRALTSNGTIPDRGPEAIVARRCCAAIPDATFIPPRTRAFLNRHFIGDGALRVCGTAVDRGAFTIGVPQTYAVIARDPGRVVIDGAPYDGPRFLAAGRHTLQSPEPEVTVIWWRAVSAKVDETVWFGVHMAAANRVRLRGESVPAVALHRR